MRIEGCLWQSSLEPYAIVGPCEISHYDFNNLNIWIPLKTRTASGWIDIAVESEQVKGQNRLREEIEVGISVG